MANGLTYGITFPFRDSFNGKFLDLTDYSSEEIRSNLIHLLLTRKGSRYYLPDFGTRIYEYIFEPLDGPTFAEIESEIRESVETYMPGVLITNIKITDASTELENKGTFINSNDQREFTVPTISQLEHTARVRIDYRVTSESFESGDFIILNI
jgi:phage baseplate assembly protein W